MKEIFQKIANTLRDERDIALVSHIQPDGDAIGSILALGLALLKSGHMVQILNPDGVPQVFTFLPGCDLIRRRFLYLPDTVVLMDCTDLDRIGALGKEVGKAPNLINIDHHISNTFFGGLNLVDTDAAATGEITYNLIKALGIKLDSEIASSLYTAVVTDTGSFKFENTTSETHMIAAELLSYGTDLSTIRTHLWESIPIESIRLITEILKTLELDASCRIAWVTVPYAMFQKFRATTDHLEGIVNYPKSVRGVEVGIIFKEFEPNKIKVGLRSKAVVDVNKVAAALGGGGHQRAAGCFVEAPLEEAKRLVIQEVKKYLDANLGQGGQNGGCD